MKKIALSVCCLLSMLLFLGQPIQAQGTQNYLVQRGDSMWRIAQTFQVGVSEIIAANPQISNPNMIYPNQKLAIPNIDELKHFENQVINLTNQQRSKAGLKPLKANWELSRVARHKSEEMANLNYFSHTSPRYGSPFDMIRAFGISFRAAGENIAKGQTSPDEVVQAWMNSSGHRANILKPEFTEIGVGYSANGHLWTQQFISR